jgi:Zn-dependent M16 (insulinase) family peptidase
VNASAGHVVIWSKGLQRRTPELIQTLGEILPDFRCDETQRLRELLTQARADLEMSITDRGHQLAMHGAMRGLSPSAWLGDLWDGPTQILSLQAQEDAVRESDAAALELLGKYAALKDKLLTAPCKVLLVGETEALDTAAATLARASALASGATESSRSRIRESASRTLAFSSARSLAPGM